MPHPLRSGVRVAIAGVLATAVLAAPAMAAGPAPSGDDGAQITMRKAGGERPDAAAVRRLAGEQHESIIAVLRHGIIAI
jgi:hypothetical protein